MIDKNWEKEWLQTFDERQAMYSGESGLNYWEARAEDFSEMRVSKQYEYGRKVYHILKSLLHAESNVLDIGAGPGSFLIPFSPNIKLFTAVEPSVNMVTLLKQNAERAGISNYQIIQDTWQEVDDNSFRQQFDLVIVSITLWMFRDVWRQIQRLQKVCKGYCCVVTGTGGDSAGQECPLWNSIMGNRLKPSYSEFPIIFNLLYSKGYLPEIRTFKHTAERSVESRIQQQKLFFSKYIHMTPVHESMIRNHMENEAVDGVVHEEYESVVIWWKP